MITTITTPSGQKIQFTCHASQASLARAAELLVAMRVQTTGKAHCGRGLENEPERIHGAFFGPECKKEVAGMTKLVDS